MRTLVAEASYVLDGKAAQAAQVTPTDAELWLVRQKEITVSTQADATGGGVDTKFNRGYVLSGPATRNEGYWEHQGPQFTDDNKSPELGLMTMQVILEQVLAQLNQAEQGRDFI